MLFTQNNSPGQSSHENETLTCEDSGDIFDLFEEEEKNSDRCENNKEM